MGAIIMECRISDLRYKEVINICNGQRLGYICDAIFSVGDGKIQALVIPGPMRFFGLLGREEDYILPWDSIARFGEDIILIENEREIRRGRRERRNRMP